MCETSVGFVLLSFSVLGMAVVGGAVMPFTSPKVR